MVDRITYFNVSITGIDAMSATTSRTYPRHTHDQYGVGVIDQGGHASLSDKGQVEAAAGNLIFVNPGEVHDGRAFRGSCRSWRMFYLSPPALLEAIEDVLEGEAAEAYFASPVFKDRGLRRAFNAAFDQLTRQSADSSPAATETAFLRLIAHLAVNLTSNLQSPKVATASIRRALDRIHSNPGAPLSLATLAAEIGTSRYQVIRAFARELGLTPHAYIVQQRLALARRLIRSGSALADVAAVSGFADQSHLTRAFFRQFGVTPARYGVRAA